MNTYQIDFLEEAHPGSGYNGSYHTYMYSPPSKQIQADHFDRDDCSYRFFKEGVVVAEYPSRPIRSITLLGDEVEMEKLALEKRFSQIENRLEILYDAPRLAVGWDGNKSDVLGVRAKGGGWYKLSDAIKKGLK